MTRQFRIAGGWWICFEAGMLALLLMAAPLPAQQQYGSITGLISDPSGAAVPGAAVVIANENNGVVTNLKANAEGYYTATSLLPGSYNISVSMAGFASVTRSGISLDVAQNERIDVALAVGTVTQQVEVTGQSPLLQTEAATVGQVVPETAVNQLPLNGRNYLQLTTLVPGATADATDGNAGLGGNYIGIPVTSIEVNGMKDSATSYYIDGANVTEQYINGSSITPAPDAIQEFKVLTNDMSARYGGGGAIVNVVLNSGTNALHGDVYEFLRNDVLDGRNFFALTTPELRQNQFGGSFGGPIVKDRSFFFADYQGTRILQGATFDSVVPTAQQRQGIFPNPITNPYTGQPFPNNQIPAGMLSPQAAFFLQFIPLPNSPGGTYITNGRNVLPTDQGDIRIDEQLKPSHRLSFSYSLQNGSSAYAGAYPDNGGTSGPYRTQLVNLEWTWNATSSKVNSAHLSYQRTHSFLTGQGIGTNYTVESGIGGFQLVTQTYPGFPNFSIAGYQGLNGIPFVPLYQTYDQYNIGDVLVWIKGKHTFEIGGDARLDDSYQTLAAWERGSFNFTGQYTGDGFGDFLLGIPFQGARGFARDEYGFYDRDQDLFVDDSWKVTPHLTANLGLRWDIIHPYTPMALFNASTNPYLNQIVVASNRNGQINTNTQQVESILIPIYASRIVPSSEVGLGPSLTHMDYHAFDPRLGIAYQAGRGFVIRAGYGVFHPLAQINQVASVGEINPPFIQDETGNFNTTPVPTKTLANMFPPLNSESSATLAADLGPPTFFQLDPWRTDPYVQEWNFSVQKALGQTISVQAAYVATKGTHQFFSNQDNVPLPGPGAIQSRLPNTFFAEGTLFTNAGLSNYQAVQLTAETRSWHGLYLLGAYAWGKSLDDETGDLQTSLVQDPNNTRAEYGISDFNVASRFTLSSTWNIPFWKDRHDLAGRMLGGWIMSNIITLQTGLPFTPAIATDPANTGTPMRPQRLGSGKLSNPTINEWFDYTAFAAPSCFCYGDTARNILSGPGLRDWDFSLSKEFPIRERLRIQFRAEFFNLTNTPAFGLPNTDVQAGPGVSGAIFTAGAPREVQFALKLYF
jgi:outer membrane receptor protein involved in Fe transport